MNRREFCRALALIAGGVSLTLPEQIDAIARSYELSAQHIPDGRLVAVDDVSFGFDCSPHDGSAVVTFFDGETIAYQVALNMRMTMRWPALPSGVIMTSMDRFRWTAIERRYQVDGGDRDLKDVICGTVKWIDTEGRQRTTPLQGRDRLS